MLERLDLETPLFDEILANLTIEEYETFTEHHVILPNLEKIKCVLKPAKNILAEGANWFVLKMSDLTNEEYMDLDSKGLFPYFCYDMTIDDFK